MSQFDRLIAQFRGIPSKYRGDPPDRARSISRLMDKLTREYEIETPRLEVQIIQNWKDIVGSSRAHRCQPHKYIEKTKTLIITTTNTTLRMELQFDRSRILKNLKQKVDANAFAKVEVR